MSPSRSWRTTLAPMNMPWASRTVGSSVGAWASEPIGSATDPVSRWLPARSWAWSPTRSRRRGDDAPVYFLLYHSCLLLPRPALGGGVTMLRHRHPHRHPLNALFLRVFCTGVTMVTMVSSL